MVSTFVLVGLMLGADSDKGAELPAMAPSDRAWVGRYVARPAGNEVSPRKDMELWLFESGEYYWVGVHGNGEWRRVGDELVLLPHALFDQETNFGAWEAGLEQFRGRSWGKTDPNVHAYHLDRVAGGFESDSWPFNTFAVSWKAEKPNMAEFAQSVSGFAQAFVSSVTDEDSEDIGEAEYERGAQYQYVSEHLSAAQVDELARLISEASAEEAQAIITGLFVRRHTPQFEKALLKWILDESAPARTRAVALRELSIGASRESLAAIWRLRDHPQLKRSFREAIAASIWDSKQNGFQTYARELAASEESGLIRREALHYLALFPEPDDFEVALERASGDGEESHLAKWIAIRLRPDDERSRAFLSQLREQLANMTSVEEYRGDLRVAAQVVASQGSADDLEFLERYAAETEHYYILLDFVERVRSPEAIPFLKERIGEMDISIGKRMKRLINLIEEQGKRSM